MGEASSGQEELEALPVGEEARTVNSDISLPRPVDELSVVEHR